MKHILICLILLISLSSCDAKYQRCFLIRVVDGDTLVADCDKVSTKLRLIGIDAPELAQEAWGLKSKNFIDPQKKKEKART